MRGAIFHRHEVVYYVLGVNGEYTAGNALADVLGDTVPPTEKRLTTRSKDVIYMERIGQTTVANWAMLRKLKERAEKRALELNFEGP